MITKPVQTIYDAVHVEFPDVRSLGIYNRRKIQPRNRTWSQHAWGNAWDITWPAWMLNPALRLAYLDKVFGFLIRARANGMPIGTILWRVANHWDHIHVEGLPKKRGIPPFRKKVIMADKDKGIELIQQALNLAGIVDPNGNPLVEDGIAGRSSKTLKTLVRAFLRQ